MTRASVVRSHAGRRAGTIDVQRGAADPLQGSHPSGPSPTPVSRARLGRGRMSQAAGRSRPISGKGSMARSSQDNCRVTRVEIALGAPRRLVGEHGSSAGWILGRREGLLVTTRTAPYVKAEEEFAGALNFLVSQGD